MGGARAGRPRIWRALMWSGAGLVVLAVGAFVAFWIWAETQDGQDDAKLAAIQALRAGITEGMPADDAEALLVVSGLSWSRHAAADYDPSWYDHPSMAASLPDPADDYELFAIVDRVRWQYLFFESIRIRIAVRGAVIRRADFESVYTGP